MLALEGQNDPLTPLNFRVDTSEKSESALKKSPKQGKKDMFDLGLFLLKMMPKHPAMYKYMQDYYVPGLGWWQHNFLRSR